MKRNENTFDATTVALLEEPRLTLSQVARKAGVNSSTVWRWTLRGVRGTKLVTFSIGAKRYVLASELEKFISACTAAANGKEPTAPHPETNRQAAARAKRTDAELEKLGV